MNAKEKDLSQQHLDIDSPVGRLRLEATPGGLTAVHFITGRATAGASGCSNALLHKAAGQLGEYFSGERRQFELALNPQGSPFEQDVWQQLQSVAYGDTCTYTDIARRLGDVNKVRAVGRANGRNPLPILIPCHRVIGSGNRLTGYAGGIERKRWLLQHEGAILL